MVDLKVVSWSPGDPITDEKLDAMVNNDNLLRDNMLTGQYKGHGVTKTTGIKIATGLVGIAPSKSNQQVKPVYFNNFFSTSCRPIVTTGIIASSQRMIFATIDGPGSALFPDRTGFQVHVFVDSLSKTRKITRTFYVSWIAVGF